MSSLSLDGGSRIVGTEFIKLEITGTTNLATETYVNEQIVLGAIGDTYTQAQIDGFLANKADTSYVVGNFYTQSQVDTSLTSKANQATTYTKTEVDSSLALKANQATTYTKTEVDTAVGTKANSADVYTKTEIDTNNYTKTQVDTALALKANQATTYTKTENDTALALKANQATTYTKTEVDTAVNDKVSLTGTDQTMTGKLTATTFATNTFNTNGANDITFQRNGVEYCKLREDGTVRLLEFPTSGGVSANRMYGNYFSNRSYSFDTIFEGSNATGDAREEYMRYNYATGILSIAKPLSLSSALKQDVIDTTSDVDLTVKRNNVDYFTLQVDGSNKLMNFASNGAVSANKLFGKYFSNRSYSLDTIFEGSNTAGNARVEYMRYVFTNEVLQLPKKVLVNGGDGKTEIYESTETTNNVFRIWNKETTNTPVIHLGAGATSNDMVLSTDGFTFNKAVSCANGLSVVENLTLAYNKKLQWGVNYIIERISASDPTFSFVAPTNNCSHEFIVGIVLNDAQKILTINNSEVLAKRTLKSNNFDSEKIQIWYSNEMELNI